MRSLLAKSTVLASAALIHRKCHPTSQLHCDTRRMIPAFQTTFAVPMHCASCVRDVSAALRTLDGVAGIEASLATQTLTVTGTAAPSAIVSAIQSTGRDAILRGSGASNGTSRIPPPYPHAHTVNQHPTFPPPIGAAVSILESHDPDTRSPVRGLARLVQVSPTHTLVDLTLRGLPPGRYVASVRERGDISRGAASTGGVWRGDDGPATTTTTSEETQAPTPPRGMLGEIVIGPDGAASAFLQQEVRVWEVVGRGMVVAPTSEGEGAVVVGVIARSAGVWDNEKTVCSCSGKTVWEERDEQVARGML
ncbi:hypothetical protein MMC26_004994 [Xylographa opegraphella]|nr:hypothetical protein [Xylographa opegraphella]